MPSIEVGRESGGKITVEGLKDFTRDLRKFSPELGKQLRRELRAAVKLVTDEARRLAPKKTGKLSKGIRPRVSSGGDAALESKDPAARIVEWGGRHPLFGNTDKWVFQPAQPHIFPAIKAKRDDFEKAALDAIEHAAREAGFK